MGVKLKKITPVQEHRTGVCVWLMPDGSYLGDGDGNFLSLSGEINDFIVEAKMQQAAVYWLGEVAKTGKPRWMAGARQVTDGELDEQNERLLEGYIPDEVDSARQLVR